MIDTSAPVALTELEEQLANTVELLSERIAELELASDDEGWQPLGRDTQADFSREFLRKLIQRSRVFFLHNPLINRAVTLQSYYVFGQGLTIAARHTAVNDVVQAFLDDPQNQAELTSFQERELKEQALQVEGNLFLCLFVNRLTGRVRVRTIPTDEIGEIITNPEDSREPWYYKRTWTQHTLDLTTGVPGADSRTTYYPDWRYQPASKPAILGGHAVEWDVPVYHVKVGGLPGMRFGIPEVYAALDWARAYKAFLSDWATITRALARFAFKVTTPGGARGVAAARTKLSTTVGTGDGGERNPAPVAGSSFVAAAGSGADLAPIRTAGATTSAEDGRRMLLMVAAATGLPESFFGDVSVGTLATAKSLDRPTELKFRSRQTLWADIYQALLQFVIDQAVIAPRGPLSGTLSIDEEGIRTVTLANDAETGEPMDRHISVEFPPILEHSVTETIDAVVKGITLDGKTPALPEPELLKLTMRLVLQALGVEDVDEVLVTLFPEPAEGEQPPAPATPPPPTVPDPAAVESRARAVGVLTEAGYPIEAALRLAGHEDAEIVEILDAKRRQIERDQLAAREDQIPEVSQ